MIYLSWLYTWCTYIYLYKSWMSQFKRLIFCIIIRYGAMLKMWDPVGPVSCRVQLQLQLKPQFSTPQIDMHITTANTHILPSFYPLSEAEVSKLILSNHPPVHLSLSPLISFKPCLSQLYPCSLISSSPLFTLVPFPAFKQAQVTPLL